MTGLPTKVSLIVPVYNVENYLARCLDSCVAQTLWDVEIICVNDGSTDASPDILRQFAVTDPRIQVINQPNAGLAAARNTGLRAAHGNWIMFLDSDDYLAANACERVWLESQHEPTDVVIYGSSIFPEYPQPSNWYRSVLSTSTQRFYQFQPYILFDMPGGKPFVWRQAYASKLLKLLCIEFHEEARFGEDLIFQFEVLPFARNFSVISDRLYNYRWYRENSLMRQAYQDLDYKMSEHVKMVTTITEYWSDKGLLDDYGAEYYSWLLEFMVPSLHQFKLKQRREHARKLRDVIERFELPQYGPKLNADKKRLVKMLASMSR